MADLLDELLPLGTESVPACALCGRTDVADDQAFAALLALPAPFGVRRCQCGLRWLSPRPTPAGYAAIYSDRHYFASGGSTDYGQMVGHRLAHFRERIAQIVKPGTRLLDYGAATGDFVKLAREAGAVADGVEFSAEARARARNLGVTLLPPDSHLSGGYDVIHMNHVFEHMPDPVAHLAYCREQLRTGGLLVIEVPQQFYNLADTLRRVSGSGGQQERFDAFSVHHTYFYTPATLKRLCEKAGFRTLACRTIVSPHDGAMSNKRRLLESLFGISSRLFRTGDAIEWHGVAS